MYSILQVNEVRSHPVLTDIPLPIMTEAKRSAMGNLGGVTQILKINITLWSRNT